MKLPTEDEMRTAFHALRKDEAAIIARAEPFRAAYERKRLELAEREQRELEPLIATMTAAEAGLFEIRQQLGMLARALGGRTGDAPDAA